MAVSHLLAAAVGAGAVVAAGRLRRAEPLLPAETSALAGTTLASRTAAPWVTDLLNAAYYAKPEEDRDLADLRLAFTILTTAWYEREYEPLTAGDVIRFHRAFGAARLRGSGGRTGTLDTEALLAGGELLLGDWFPEAASDPACCGWGIAFRNADDRARHDPEERLAQADLGLLAPPQTSTSSQIWQSYPAVPVTDAKAALTVLHAVDRWPDLVSSAGRLTPLRRRGLAGQTFEVEAAVLATARTPLLLRSYLTAQTVVTEANPDARDAWLTQFRVGFASRPEEPAPLPDDAELHAACELVTHRGHVLGNAVLRLLLYRVADATFLRVVGSWDPEPTEGDGVVGRLARDSQHALWGMGDPQASFVARMAAAASAAVTG